MMSLKSFSQSATDSTTIRLTKPIAKLVIKDLVKSDGLEIELLTTRSLLSITNKKLETQTSLNSNLETQIKNFNKIISSQEQKSMEQKELTELLQKDLKKQKLKTKLTGGAGILLAIGAAVLIN